MNVIFRPKTIFEIIQALFLFVFNILQIFTGNRFYLDKVNYFTFFSNDVNLTEFFTIISINDFKPPSFEEPLRNILTQTTDNLLLSWFKFHVKQDRRMFHMKHVFFA